MEQSKKEPDSKLRTIYPQLSDEELLIAEEKLDEYLRFTMRMYERIVRDPELYREFKVLTEKESGSTIDRERSNSNESSTPT
jgi:hypothetical protein